jgi:hypothetical protein
MDQKYKTLLKKVHPLRKREFGEWRTQNKIMTLLKESWINSKDRRTQPFKVSETKILSWKIR